MRQNFSLSSNVRPNNFYQLHIIKLFLVRIELPHFKRIRVDVSCHLLAFAKKIVYVAVGNCLVEPYHNYTQTCCSITSQF